jgi:hypothetical protein
VSFVLPPACLYVLYRLFGISVYLLLLLLLSIAPTFLLSIACAHFTANVLYLCKFCGKISVEGTGFTSVFGPFNRRVFLLLRTAAEPKNSKTKFTTAAHGFWEEFCNIFNCDLILLLISMLGCQSEDFLPILTQNHWIPPLQKRCEE